MSKHPKRQKRPSKALPYPGYLLTRTAAETDFANGLQRIHGDAAADLANDTPPGGIRLDPADQAGCIANSTSGPVGEDGYMRLSMYGEHPYGPGDVQVFDRAAAKSMVLRFRAAANAVVRALFRTSGTRPVYHGHPDHPVFAAAGHDDYTLRAEIEDIEDREDGLYVKPAWTDAGNDLRAKAGKLYWSPRWLTEPIGETASGIRRWRPYKLLSAGLTPTPNILGSAANASLPPTHENPEKQNTMNPILLHILTALGLEATSADAANSENADATEIPAEIADRLTQTLDAANGYYDLMVALMRALGYSDAEIEAYEADRVTGPSREDITARLSAALGARTTADAANATLTTERDTLSTQLDAANTALAAERRERAALIVDRAITERRLPEAERTARIDSLASAEDIANAAATLLATAPILPGAHAGVEGLGQRRGEALDAANAATSWREGLEAHAKTHSLDLANSYEKATASYVSTAEGKARWAAMRTPKTDA